MIARRPALPSLVLTLLAVGPVAPPAGRALAAAQRASSMPPRVYSSPSSRAAVPEEAAAVATAAPLNPALPLPAGLVPQVEFWKAIYSRVSKDQVLFHDRNRLDVVYGLLSSPEPLTPGAETANRWLLESTRDRYTEILQALADGFDPDTLAGETRRVYELWGSGSTPGTFAAAAENVRWQRGLRERFIEGLAFSGRYQPYVEQVFEEEGIPRELTYLPFVESMYNIRAYSSVGAAGVWQFMPGTARLFMRVDGTFDERMDPIHAARSAARLLRKNYDALGTWPLAITAYNHGLYGMKNAVRAMASRDIERIVKDYQGRAFGFASRNFYTEFLAALEVRSEYQRYLGNVRLDPPMEFEEVRVPFAVRLSTLARELEVPVEALWELNLAVTPRARREDRAIPAGYVLRLPEEAADEWDDALDDLRERVIAAAPARGAGPAAMPQGDDWYVVRRGDTLGAIAARHDVPLTTLRSLNGLSRRSLIHPGQRLRLSR